MLQREQPWFGGVAAVVAVGKWAVLFCPLFHSLPGIFRLPSAVPQEILKQVVMNAKAIRLVWQFHNMLMGEAQVWDRVRDARNFLWESPSKGS